MSYPVWDDRPELEWKQFVRNSGYNPDFAKKVRIQKACASGQPAPLAAEEIPPALRREKMVTLLQEAPRCPRGRTPRGVVKWVCDYWGVDMGRVLGQDKSNEAQLVRSHAMRDLWLIFGGVYSNVQIGAILQRDHTAVARAIELAGYRHNARPGGRTYPKSPLVQEDPGCAEGA